MIEEYLSIDGGEKFKDLVMKYNIGEFIEEFVKYGKPPLDLLMSSCPQIKPRLYSIASSPLQNRNRLTLAIANLLFGKGRHGLCTHYLNAMNPKTVPMKIQKGAFLYPKDTGTPMIMAALGAGIAPVLALLEHRKIIRDEEHLGKAVLYFGARNKAGYVELEKILDGYKNIGVLEEYYIAYSRDGQKKVYITDLMQNDINRLWEYWKDDRAEFFYCGPPRGIPDTLRKIMDKVVAQGKNITEEEGNKINQDHHFWLEAF